MIAPRMLSGLLAAALLGTAPVTVSPPGVGAVPAYVQRDASPLSGGILISLAAGSLREKAATSGLAALTAHALERSSIDGAALRDAIAAQGGILAADVTARSARFYVEAPPAQLAACLAILGRALAHPAFDAASVAAARTAAVARATDAERLPLEVGLNMVRQSYYQGTAGQPVAGERAVLAGLSEADVVGFAAANYRRTGAVIAAVGAVDDGSLAAAQAVVAALPDGGAALPTIAVHAPSAAPRRIVAHRDIGAPWLVLGFAAPGMRDRDYAAILVVQALIASTFDDPAPVTKSVYGRGIGSVYQTELRPAQLAVYVNGAQTDIAAGLRNIDVVVKTLGTRTLRPPMLAEAKARARGALLTASLTLQDRATDLAADAENGVDPAMFDVAASIGKVTGADVLRAAKTYLQRFTAAVVLPREATTAPLRRS